MGSVVVVGSINVDVVMHVPGFPVPGATLLADRVERSPGGKGANQAVAAARAGAATRLLGAVGDDGDSAPQVDALVAAGVDVSGVETCSGRTTGTAFVMVAPSGENAIVVDAGANGLLDLRRVVAALSDRGTTAPDVVLLQSEVGAAVVDAAAAAAYERGIRVVVNNGPWLPLAAATLEAADPLVVNEHEAAEACDASGAEGAEGADLADAVRRRHGCRSVVVTRGAEGASISGAEASARIAALPVERVVDTTGAGDAFVGTLAAVLAQGRSLRRAVEEGQRAGAAVVARLGARGDR
jgi:ribokinase